MGRSQESHLTDRILKHLQRQFPYAKFYKIHQSGYGQNGIPDILGCVQGRFVALEVKMPKKMPTKLQQRELALINVAGGVSAVVSTPEQAFEVCASLGESCKPEWLRL